MYTWDDFKDYVREIDPAGREEMDQFENLVRLSILINKQREYLGFSQEELAKRCHIPLEVVKKLEGEDIMPSVPVLYNILRQLDLDVIIQPRVY